MNTKKKQNEKSTRSYSDCCDWNACTECGECLMRCPVMRMEKGEAQKEIGLLLAGERAPRVFDECTLCFSCNNFCPEGLRPHELILQRVIEGRKNGRVNAFIPYLINGLPEANLFNDIYERLSREEKSILDRWERVPEPSDEILMVGCVGRISCYDIEHSEVLRGMPKYGPRDLCCGELAYRLGSWQCYADIAERAVQRLSRLKCKRLVTYCGSCYNFLSNILKNVYGEKLPFKIVSLYQWLWEHYEKGTLTVKNPISFKAAIHESCYVSELDGMGDLLRKLYRAVGADIVELPHNREEQLSCGMISFGRDQNIFKSVFKNQLIKYRESWKSGVRALACNCPGCVITMSFSNFLFGVKLRYMPDELLHAFGDRIRYPLRKRIPLITRIGAMRLPTRAFKSVDNTFPRIPLEGRILYEKTPDR
ncbi:MAG: (Fe-S)-binding protein [Spirochaetes bacterium]|nr:(Fe-S)-binding protein [Spirochaetota bacterium]